MADNGDGGGWSKLLDRLQSPGAWIAAGVGALGGAAVSISVLGSDFGTSIATGAVVGVTAKATGDSALERRRLRKKSVRFSEELKEDLSSVSPMRIEALKKIANSLQVQNRLWERKLIDNNTFAKVLENLINEFAKEMESSS
ncbi:MAG: hypothetical protein QOD11_539 [Bradyrhizobium sp.]|jgi:hypothetical protein|nr:hypothetical protein [Bradyrhizobium sp.]